MSPTENIYRLLLARFGPRGWWPTTPKNKLRPVYYPNLNKRPLSSKEKFEICAGAILTQNTAWANVVKALEQLNAHGAMDPRKIAKLPAHNLARLIRSSGYFRQKARKLRIFSNHLIEKHGGDAGRMLDRPWPVVRKELLGLWGVGPETADSILLYAGGRPVFVVDAYTRRIGNRFGLFKTKDYDAIQKHFNKTLPRSAQLFNEYHSLLVELGKRICKTKPQCAQCPLQSACRKRY